MAQDWAIHVSAYQAFAYLLPEIERGAFLSHGRYRERCVATLTRDGDHPDQLCNAVSGWSATPLGAIVDLAFRWAVLCDSSWLVASHVPLVSTITA